MLGSRQLPHGTTGGRQRVRTNPEPNRSTVLVAGNDARSSRWPLADGSRRLRGARLLRRVRPPIRRCSVSSTATFRPRSCCQAYMQLLTRATCATCPHEMTREGAPHVTLAGTGRVVAAAALHGEQRAHRLGERLRGLGVSLRDPCFSHRASLRALEPERYLCGWQTTRRDVLGVTKTAQSPGSRGSRSISVFDSSDSRRRSAAHLHEGARSHSPEDAE
jgi:hypothetical protein